MSQPPIPTVLTFLLCDQVITEAQTNKKSLIGVFDRIWAEQVPAVHLPPIWVFAKIADADGEYTFRIEIVRLESDRPIGRVVTPRSVIIDPLKTVDLALKLPPMPFEEFGTYEFQLFANETWIGRTKMTVQKRGAETS